MARKTKEQRLEEERLAQEAVEARRVEFLKELPTRLYNLVQTAKVLNEPVVLNLLPTATQVVFVNRDEVFTTNQSEEWRVEMLEETFKARLDELEAKKAREQLARDTLKALTPEQVAALKEFQLLR